MFKIDNYGWGDYLNNIWFKKINKARFFFRIRWIMIGWVLTRLDFDRVHFDLVGFWSGWLWLGWLLVGWILIGWFLTLVDFDRGWIFRVNFDSKPSILYNINVQQTQKTITSNNNTSKPLIAIMYRSNIQLK